MGTIEFSIIGRNAEWLSIGLLSLSWKSGFDGNCSVDPAYQNILTTNQGAWRMQVHIFRGTGRVFGVTTDAKGTNLPSQYGPWTAFKVLPYIFRLMTSTLRCHPATPPLTAVPVRGPEKAFSRLQPGTPMVPPTGAHNIIQLRVAVAAPGTYRAKRHPSAQPAPDHFIAATHQ